MNFIINDLLSLNCVSLSLSSIRARCRSLPLSPSLSPECLVSSQIWAWSFPLVPLQLLPLVFSDLSCKYLPQGAHKTVLASSGLSKIQLPARPSFEPSLWSLYFLLDISLAGCRSCSSWGWTCPLLFRRTLVFNLLPPWQESTFALRRSPCLLWL